MRVADTYKNGVKIEMKSKNISYISSYDRKVFKIHCPDPKGQSGR